MPVACSLIVPTLIALPIGCTLAGRTLVLAVIMLVFLMAIVAVAVLVIGCPIVIVVVRGGVCRARTGQPGAAGAERGRRLAPGRPALT